MSHRYIDLNLPEIPDARIVAWLEANGIDPNNTPSAQYVQVTDEYLIYQEFRRGSDGHKLPIHDNQGEACAWQKRVVTAPLLSRPEDHNL